MTDNEKNVEKPTRKDECDLQQDAVRTYPLETIMALQKALENGITAEGTLLSPTTRVAEPERAIASDAQSGVITQIRKSLTAMRRGLGRALQLAAGSKKQSKRTSA